MKKTDSLLVLAFAITILGSIIFITIPALCTGEKMAQGKPITPQDQNFVGRTFTPLAFMITDERTLIYNADGKVYALDNINLDNGLTTVYTVNGTSLKNSLAPESPMIGSNITYLVYSRGNNLFFGRK